VNEKEEFGWLIPLLLFIAAIIIVLDQAVKTGVIWNWEQVLHHENLALILISAALGMLLSRKISKKRKDIEK